MLVVTLLSCIYAVKLDMTLELWGHNVVLDAFKPFMENESTYS